MNASHPDYADLEKLRVAILDKAGGQSQLNESFPVLVRDAIDYVIDPVRTGRTTIAELDNVEKTFIGLKVEHFLRDLLDVPKGVRDLVLDGEHVDVKNTVRTTWMIPKETYDEEGACLLICVADDDGRCWLGLMLARKAYLNKPNRDKKRSVSAAARVNILWLIDGFGFPKSSWSGLDMTRFRELRLIRPGSLRAATFFVENIGRVVHRRVVQSLLHDQQDYMKRLRANGGAKDLLLPQGIILLNGGFDAREILRRRISAVSPEDWVAVRK